MEIVNGADDWCRTYGERKMSGWRRPPNGTVTTSTARCSFWLAIRPESPLFHFSEIMTTPPVGRPALTRDCTVSRWILNSSPFPISDVLLYIVLVIQVADRSLLDTGDVPITLEREKREEAPCHLNRFQNFKQNAVLQWLKGSKGSWARCWMPLQQCPCYRSSAKEIALRFSRNV